MVNYGNGKVYRIVCDSTGKQYIGSTTASLSARLCQHLKLFKNANTCSSREVIESGNYSIVLIEDFPCVRKEQLLARERYYIETTHCVNKNIPLRTQHEWYMDNREKVIQRQTEWNIQNPEKTRLYKQIYQEKMRNNRIDNDLDAEFLEFTEIYNDDVKLHLGGDINKTFIVGNI